MGGWIGNGGRGRKGWEMGGHTGQGGGEVGGRKEEGNVPFLMSSAVLTHRALALSVASNPVIW